jgi:hyperosmotically inducible protein
MVSYRYPSKNRNSATILLGINEAKNYPFSAENGKRGGSVRNVKTLTVFMILGIVLFWLWGCTTPGGRTPGQVFDDGAITTTVKTKLVADSGLKGFKISVTTFKGQVTLSGKVESSSERKKAAKLAQSTKGVKRVVNKIKVQ